MSEARSLLEETTTRLLDASVDRERRVAAEQGEWLGDLWGAIVPEATQRLRERFGPGWAFAVIGPAGENLVRFATISHDNRHAGRGGLGAILGSKNLKTVAVRGAKRTEVADPTGTGEQDFLADLSDRDLSVSSLASSAPALRKGLGFDPVTADWEILGQSRAGMVMILKVSDETDLGDVADHYAKAGFSRPDDDAMSGGVWEGGPDVITGVDMFVRQAALQYGLFTGREAPRDVMREALKRAIGPARVA